MIPRSEHPKPQFQRDNWMNLNGPWAFEIDQSRSGEARKLYAVDAALSQQIIVPFCPESDLSGVGYKDFIPAVWYKRAFTLPAEAMGNRVMLHFGAGDYQARVWVNGQEVGTHKGG